MARQEPILATKGAAMMDDDDDDEIGGCGAAAFAA